MSRFDQFRSLFRRSLPWLLLAAFVSWISSGTAPHAAFPIGSQLPATSLPLALSDGSQFTLTGSHESVVVLNFWASYCEPCRVEAPVLSAAQAQATDIKVIGLSVETVSADVAASQARRIGMRYAVGVADEALLSRLRVQSVPTTYVIAKNGKVVLSRVGAISSGELEAALAAGRDAS
jgi:cytochrome c biogenesis protein CcmG/thiol:disulfide interchange protein DsbE